MTETSPIKFILNDQLREAEGLPPTMTVLEYLRTEKRLTGTKEGCAEGDCGACTVIVGELKGGQVRYKAVNACILFLPVLDGKHVITIEYLENMSDDLHPVQQAMIDCHGSQCGFCTPGFVMSLATLLHNTDNATKENIQDSISGNLCRCTGYNPILKAAEKANLSSGAERRLNTKTDSSILHDLQRDTTFSYEAKGKKFFAPRTTEDFASLLEEYPQATILAGGTDVGLWVTKQHRQLDTVIYTGAIESLHNMEETENGLEIGAAVSYQEAFDKLASYDESMEELLRRLGSVQIRNSGTIGGNIANGSPIGDGMPPLIALGAQIVLRSAKGARTIKLEDYFIAYGKQDRQDGEFLEKIIVPAKPDNMIFKTYKLSKRFDQDISAVCGAFSLKLDGNIVKDAVIAYGGMAATPKRAQKTESFLNGKEWSEETAHEAMTYIAQDFAPLTDMRASSKYRSMAAQNMLYRFYLETTAPEEKIRVYKA